jgi:hypothetical protein
MIKFLGGFEAVFPVKINNFCLFCKTFLVYHIQTSSSLRIRPYEGNFSNEEGIFALILKIPQDLSRLCELYGPPRHLVTDGLR